MLPAFQLVVMMSFKGQQAAVICARHPLVPCPSTVHPLCVRTKGIALFVLQLGLRVWFPDVSPRAGAAQKMTVTRTGHLDFQEVGIKVKGVPCEGMVP